MKRTKILPPQPQVECEVRFKLLVVLNKEGVDVRADVLIARSGSYRTWIEVRALGDWRVVREVPEVVKLIVWNPCPGRDIVVLLLVNVGAKLDRMAVAYLGQGVAEIVSGLVEDPGTRSAEHRAARQTDLTDPVNIVLRKSKRLLRVRLDLIKPPAGYVETRFVEDGWRNGVIPQQKTSVI